MRTVEVITIVILFLISIAAFIIGYFQFKEKGILFNNAYLYASKEERATMNKKPHYRQSAIVFASIGFIFLLNAVELLVRSGWLFLIDLVLIILLLVYAIVSSVMIARKNKGSV
ncbi:MAG TPA: DUF3784 domain-containing protein [Fusibacter sp.]|nr:DUF3784 domain-containing protein [Fusibacter sp.]